MHRGKGVFSVNNKATIQHYLMRSAKVMWGIWVLGLHEEKTNLELGMTCQAPLPFGGNDNNRRSIFGRSRPFIFLWI